MLQPGQTPRVVKVCEPARGGVHALAFGPKGALFAGCARWDVPVLHGAVAAFDPATGKETWRTTTAMGGVYALAVSPDGKKLAGAGLDGQVRVWDAATGKELAAWKGHTDRCTGVAWALGGKAIVTAGFDHTVRVWDAATGENHVTAGAQVGPSVRVAVHPGIPGARMYDAPALFGFRPGYVYRLELSNLPYHPNRVLYPEVEVRGVLVPRAGMKYMDWPAPLTFTAADIEKALAGGVVVKAIYLEDPDKALPVEVGLNAPIEVPADTEEDAIKEAIANGRLVAIVRLGGKVPPVAQLQATAVDGTVLVPGERYLRAPLMPPCLPFTTSPFYDPISGPRPPGEECFVDGGDRGAPLGIGPGGRLGGLNPTDVGVEYTIAGTRRVTTSNVVCLCVPRFVIQRAELVANGVDAQLPLTGHIAVTGPAGLRDRVAAQAEAGRERLAGLLGRTRLMGYHGVVGVGFYVGTDRPMAVGRVEGVRVEAALVEPEVLTWYAGCPLTVSKRIDADGPVNAGDTVTITLRYTNTGNRPVSDLVVSDSLSGRLEFVPGSAESDRAANFTAGANEAGSAIVRWELPGTLLPGQGGTVRFKAKVR